MTNADDDTAGVSVTPTGGLTTTEAGGSATFTVVLTSQPTANVTIPISSGDTTEGQVNKTFLTFTPSNWNVAQTVTVTGVNDQLDDGDVSYSVLVGDPTSADPTYERPHRRQHPRRRAHQHRQRHGGRHRHADQRPDDRGRRHATFTVVLTSAPSPTSPSRSA